MDRLPLYPDEKTIALAVMGSARAKDWPAKARYLEKKGLPRIDELMGGRFWPAVVEFFKIRHGLVIGVSGTSVAPNGIRIMPFAPDGKENFDTPSRRRQRR